MLLGYSKNQCNKTTAKSSLAVVILPLLIEVLGRLYLLWILAEFPSALFIPLDMATERI